MNIKYYISLLLLLWTGTLLAQTVKFTASATKTELGTNDPFQVTFSVNGNGENFSPPNLSGFQIVGGPNQSSSMEMVNGVTTVNIEYSYVLVAQKEGDFIIGPASIVVNGRKLTTNPIKIKVVKGHTVSQNAPDKAITDGSLAKSLFLRILVDKDNVYQGQQLTLTYRVYFKVGIQQTLAIKLPDLTGFWNEDVKASPTPQQPKIEVYNGVKYNTVDIKQIILFPEHAGNIKIDPFSMDLVVRVPAPSRDIMDQFFNGTFEDKKYSAKSEPFVVHVKPLPEAGKPLGFGGAVGNFTIQSSIDKTDLKANEALNYKIKVTGSGNIKLLKDQNTNFPIDFEKYDPKITDTVNESVNGVSGSRIYSYLLIPRHGGDYTIDPVKFSYFNPATGRYVSLATNTYKVTVEKGKNETNVTALSGADKQDVKVLDKDIRYLKTGDLGLIKQGERFYGSVEYYLLLLLGPVLCLCAYVFRKQNAKYNSDIVKVKSRRASRVAAKHMANAKKQLLANNTHAFYEAVFRGLYGYLGDKLNITYADLNKDIIASALKDRGVDAPLIGRLEDTIELCEMARYAPVTHISQQEVFEKAKGIINDIEDEI